MAGKEQGRETRLEDLTSAEIQVLKEMADNYKTLNKLGRWIKTISMWLGGVFLTWVALGEAIERYVVKFFR